MKYLLLLFVTLGSIAHAQLSTQLAKEAGSLHGLIYYTYLEGFEGYAGYAAPAIQTADGGAVVCGTQYGERDQTTGVVVKLDSDGRQKWVTHIAPNYNDLEVQGILQDQTGYYFVFVLSYNYKKYGGGVERVIFLDPQGELVWDKEMGPYTLLNSPTFAWIKLLEDGSVAVRGHIVTEKPLKGQDPVYRYWEGVIDNQGEMTQQIGDVMDYEKDPSWELKYLPE
jgi:hypothetical protein